MHEASLYDDNSFVTLTYDNNHLPNGGTLVKKHTQDFLKRARYHIGPFRYFICGEYGETTRRPHYHAIIFGKDWLDKKHFKTTDLGHSVYTSERLEQIWGMGQCLTAAVTFESIAYTTRYVVDKITGPPAAKHYDGREPEFGEMSRRPGLGRHWLDKYASDVYTTDNVIINGKEQRPPSYYDTIHARTAPEAMAAIKAKREIEAYENRWDNTPARLTVKETVHKAKIEFLQRNKQ